MSQLENGGEGFYLYAMKLFSKAGHVAISEPEFTNHSPEQFVYFDNKSDVFLSRNQRAMFRAFNNISRLFSFNDCAFLSINLLTEKDERSQAAHDIHTMIHPVIGTDGSVCLFRYDDEIMLSFVGYGLHCILSDWYPVNDDYERLLEMLNISNISIDRGMDYFLDMVYALARSYYLSPKNPSIYEMLPNNFISGAGLDEIDREELNQIVEYELSKPRCVYGDDYVEYDEPTASKPIDIGAELDLMFLEMDVEDEIDNPFGEELESEDDEHTESEGYFDEDTDHDEIKRDEYEFNDVDPEIFRDPVLMVKWLQKMSDSLS